MKIVKGTSLAMEIKESLKEKIALSSLQFHRSPSLALILVGSDEQSKRYVQKKVAACEEVGIVPRLFSLPETTSQQELLNLVTSLNDDTATDGILVQLPLPPHIDKNLIINSIDSQKDVDGLHPFNIGKLTSGQEAIIPCTPKGVLSLLRSLHISLKGKNVVVIGRSDLVGKPMAQLLLRENASVTICHSHTSDLETFTRNADILISAVGQSNLILPHMLKKDVVVIDVGISTCNGRLVGDVFHPERLSELEEVVSIITAVPGGIGPITVAALLENTFEIYNKRLSI